MSLEALFSGMYCDDTELRRWLDAHCDHVHHFWNGRHYFGTGKFDYIRFRAVEDVVEGVFDIYVTYAELDEYISTNRVSELLAFLRDTNWFPVEVPAKTWLDEDLVPAHCEEMFVWNGTFTQPFKVQPDVVRTFRVEMDRDEQVCTIYHGVEGTDPIRLPNYPSEDDAYEAVGRKLYKLYMDDYFKKTPIKRSLNDLRRMLNLHGCAQPWETTWVYFHRIRLDNGGTMTFTIHVTEFIDGFRMELRDLKGAPRPFRATSEDTFVGFIRSIDWKSLCPPRREEPPPRRTNRGRNAFSALEGLLDE
jgi:hypothetical protein